MDTGVALQPGAGQTTQPTASVSKHGVLHMEGLHLTGPRVVTVALLHTPPFLKVTILVKLSTSPMESDIGLASYHFSDLMEKVEEGYRDKQDRIASYFTMKRDSKTISDYLYIFYPLLTYLYWHILFSVMLMRVYSVQIQWFCGDT